MSQSTVLEWTNENEFRAFPLTSDSIQFASVNNTQIDLYKVFLDANIVFNSEQPTPVPISFIKRENNTLVIAVGTGANQISFILPRPPIWKYQSGGDQEVDPTVQRWSGYGSYMNNFTNLMINKTDADSIDQSVWLTAACVAGNTITIKDINTPAITCSYRVVEAVAHSAFWYLTVDTQTGSVSTPSLNSLCEISYTPAPIFPKLNFPVYLRSGTNLLVLGEEVLSLYSALTDNEYINITAWLEPSVIMEQTGLLLGVTQLSFSSNNQFTSGDIRLIEGLQTDIQTLGQTILLNVGRNEGKVLDCASYFTIDPIHGCDKIISNINGAYPAASGDMVKLIAGDHIKIYEDTVRARIYIGLDFVAADACDTPLLPPIP